MKGNFLRLMDIVARATPLPLAPITNRRSLIYVGNLVDAIVKAIDAPCAAGRTCLVSDGEDVSTPDLVRALAQALGVRPRFSLAQGLAEAARWYYSQSRAQEPLT